MSESLDLSEKFLVHPDILWNAWMDSHEHSDFTGSEAEINPAPEGAFTAWDGYISGKNIELIPGQKIIQAWRTRDFTDSDPDSRLEILFTEIPEGCLLSLSHNGLPAGSTEEYIKGWKEYYFKPMKIYFK